MRIGLRRECGCFLCGIGVEWVEGVGMIGELLLAGCSGELRREMGSSFAQCAAECGS